jgi:hypothetical protein
MLNLHGVLGYGFKLEQVFYDLRRKHEGNYVYGRRFVTDTALDITETLGMIFFCLNALTGGRDIGLFYILDNFKKQINDCIDISDSRDTAITDGDKRPKAIDPILALLGIISDYTAGGDFSEDGSISGELERAASIRDILNYCYDRVFGILDSLLQSVTLLDRSIAGGTAPIIGIPVSYFLSDKKPVFEKGLFSGETHDASHSNPGASRLVEGIYDVQDSILYAPFLEKSRSNANLHGMLIYSNETLVLYHLPGKFKNLVSANIRDAVGGNHINLLIGSTDHANLPPSAGQLVKKLLDGLDFRTFEGHGFVIASIRNITRGETENHLNMLGKLISFVSSTRIAPSDDESVARNIDVFLENII